MPSLYVVATPIGNLEDVTLRALRVLREVGLIAAEDTRVTRRLLSKHRIHTRLTSYNDRNKLNKLPSILAALKEKDVALVSDAGMPGINDPGYELVSEAAKVGIPVVSVPGASALTSALSISGLPVPHFVFLGFLPRKKGERRRLLESLVFHRGSLVAFEPPHRLKSALTDVLEILGDRRIAVCREMTKVHEEVFRGTVSEALEHFVDPRGELVVIIEGGVKASHRGVREEIMELLLNLDHKGLGAREAAARVSKATGISRRECYQLWVEVKNDRSGPGTI